MIKWVFILLGILILLLQYQLWFSNGILHVMDLSQEVNQLVAKNEISKQNNQKLEKEILSLKSELPMVEGRARFELGMVKPDETFYQFTKPTRN